MDTEITFQQILDYKYNDSDEYINNELMYNLVQKKIDDNLINSNNCNYFEKILKKIGICPKNCKCKNNKCNNIIIIFSKRKSGSTSLWSSFNIFLPNYIKFHLHDDNDLIKLGLPFLKIEQFISIMNFFNKNIFVFDIYRPVFDTMMSLYMFTLPVIFQRHIKDLGKLKKELFIKRFLNFRKYLYDLSDNDLFFNLLKNKINFNTFDHINKYLFFEDKNIKYYKLRLCDSKNWGNILSNIFKTKIIIVKINDTLKKEVIGEIYSYLNDNLYIDAEFYNIIKDNKNFLFYYNNEEQTNYLSKLKLKNKDEIPTLFPVELINFYMHILSKNESVYLFDKDSRPTNLPLIFDCYCDNCQNKRNKIKLSLLLKEN